MIVCQVACLCDFSFISMIVISIIMLVCSAVRCMNSPHGFDPGEYQPVENGTCIIQDSNHGHVAVLVHHPLFSKPMAALYCVTNIQSFKFSNCGSQNHVKRMFPKRAFS